MTVQNDIFSNNDVFFVLDWWKWGTGAIDITLAHARFLWAGAIAEACWVIGRFPAGWVEETVILGWDSDLELCCWFCLALPASLASGRCLDGLKIP